MANKKSAWNDPTIHQVYNIENGHVNKMRKKHHGNFIGFSNHDDKHAKISDKNSENHQKTASSDIADYASLKGKRFNSGSTVVSAEKTREKSASDKESTTCTSKLLKMWADDDSVLRLSWTTVLMIVFCFVTAGIVFALEKGSKCERTYWESLWFVNTIYTTVGFGYLTPCTDACKGVVMLLALIGIPINVLSLTDVGKLMARFLSFLWKYIRLCWKKIKRKSSGSSKNKNTVVVIQKDPQLDSEINNRKTEENEVSDVPLSLALIITIIWFVLCITFFHFTEIDQSLTFFDWFYFIILTVTTVGFGDISPKRYNLVIVQFFFLIIGIALFSMVINIVQDKLDSLSDNVEDLINKEYAEAAANGDNLHGGDDEKSARDQVRNIIKKQTGGAFLKFAMGKNMEDRLVQDYMNKAQKRLISTQTDNIVHDREIDAVPVMSDKVAGTDFIGVSTGTQLRWMPVNWTPVQMQQLAPDRLVKGQSSQSGRKN